MGIGIFPRTLLSVVVLTVSSCPMAVDWAEPINAAGPMRAAGAEAYPYYVEFRVALDGVYGHSYIAYGRLNALGQPATASYADIHPAGDLASMVLGHFMPMDAATRPEKETLERKIASRFQRRLTAAEYDRLKALIAHIRAARHAWSIVAYNCNDFVADVARGIGMQTPTTLSLPYQFIPKLQALNEHALRPEPPLAYVPPNVLTGSRSSTN